MQSWYVLHTKPRCEPQVEAGLAAEGIETYYPVLPAPRRVGRPSVRPFFPCYLFAHLVLEEVGISKLKWLPGMRDVVAFDGIPARVDEIVVQRIRERLATAELLDGRGKPLTPGDRVVITTAPFENVDAVFETRLSPAGRVRVLIHLMQRWTALDLDAGNLRRLPPTP